MFFTSSCARLRGAEPLDSGIACNSETLTELMQVQWDGFRWVWVGAKFIKVRPSNSEYVPSGHSVSGKIRTFNGIESGTPGQITGGCVVCAGIPQSQKTHKKKHSNKLIFMIFCNAILRLFLRSVQGPIPGPETPGETLRFAGWFPPIGRHTGLCAAAQGRSNPNPMNHPMGGLFLF